MRSLKNNKKAKKPVRFSIVDSDENLEKSESKWQVLEKSMMVSLADLQSGKSKMTRLAFEENPNDHHWFTLWVPKQDQVPDHFLKMISKKDDLVFSILQARQGHISQFGRELQDRYSKGVVIEPRRGKMDAASPQQKEQLKLMIEQATRLLSTCGSETGVEHDDKMSLSTFMGQQARNGVLFGRFATEIRFTTEMDGTRTFHSFRPLDAGTIYRAPPRGDAGLEAVREQALAALEDLQNEKLQPEKFRKGDYSWVQVIDQRARQAFTSDECYVHNVYPVTDIELAGYPLTPIDGAIDAILTHMNITNHNRLYFQSGRAARGMIVIKSADINQEIVAQIRTHFNASINGVENSWRVPVFGIDPDEEISWEPLEFQGGRDQEFQYLADSNARVIMAAFQISPDELPGYNHLSRGSNQQTMSESDNEWKLESAQDTGIRPLLLQFQDFLNERILPLIDPLLAQLCVVKLAGLDADNPEKEQQRLMGASTLYGTADFINGQVEMPLLGKAWGGDVPLNPAVQAVFDKYLTVGEQKEHFLGVPGAGKDPTLAYFRDPFWFNYQQLLLQQQQLQQQQLQQQQLQQQAQQGQSSGYGESDQSQGGGESSAGGDSGGKDEGSSGGGGPSEKEGPGELETGVDQLMQMLNKSEAQLPAAKRRVLAQHRATVKAVMDAWEEESKKAIDEIMAAAKKTKPKKS